MRNFSRRKMIFQSVAAMGAYGAAQYTAIFGSAAHAEKGKKFEITRSEAEWRKRLGPDAYFVLREEGTERPYTSPLNDEKRKGVYACAGCNLGLYKSNTKYDSGTGWPSFWQSIDGRVGTSTDYKLFYPRTEVHCRRCGGHLGHIFSDGPKPTGKRHCLNGLALRFIPA